MSLRDLIGPALPFDGSEGKLQSAFEEDESCIKLGVDEEVAADVMLAYRNKLQSMQQSLA